MNESFNLDRFIAAQERLYSSVLRELETGRKISHWMWFIFPQVKGLGRSSTSEHYAIRSLEEAGAYLGHAILGARLRECTKLVLSHPDKSLVEIFGFPDDLKFCSSMTLFAQAAKDERMISKAIDLFCEGTKDEKTLQLLELNM